MSYRPYATWLFGCTKISKPRADMNAKEYTVGAGVECKSMVTKADNDDDSTTSVVSTTSSSATADTNAALLEMLGIDDNDYNFDHNDGIGEVREEEVKISKVAEKQDSAMPVHVIDLPKRCSRYLHAPDHCCAFVLSSIINASECQYLIEKGAHTSRGFHYVTEAAHMDESGETIRVKLQNPNDHKLSVFEDAKFLDVLWERIRRFVEPGSGRHVDAFYQRTKCGKPSGLNRRVRVLRYDADANDRFEPHFDATTRIEDQTSLLTVLVYLCDGEGIDFEGGETLYLDSHVSSLNKALNLDDTGCTKVTPRRGDVVIFEHDLYHSGAPLNHGTKFVMRTDIMFSSNEAGIDSAAECRRRKLSDSDSKGNDEATNGTITFFADPIGLGDEERQYLDSMGLLNVTADAFLAPGLTALKVMLVDGISNEKVEQLLSLAIEAVKNNQ